MRVPVRGPIISDSLKVALEGGGTAGMGGIEPPPKKNLRQGVPS